MSEVVKDRLIEAANLADRMDEAYIAVTSLGVTCKMFYKDGSGELMVLHSVTPWDSVQNCTKNPLIAAFTSLTKQFEGASLK